MNNKFYSVREVSDHLGIAIGTVYQMVASGELKAVRAGKLGTKRPALRIPQSALQALEHSTGA